MKNTELEIVKDYKYLGLYFTRTGSFLRTRKYLSEQATKAMYGIVKKCRQNSLNIEFHLYLLTK